MGIRLKARAYLVLGQPEGLQLFELAYRIRQVAKSIGTQVKDLEPADTTDFFGQLAQEIRSQREDGNRVAATNLENQKTLSTRENVSRC